MAENWNQPNNGEAVLGGNIPEPVNSDVLGRIEEVKSLLMGGDENQKIAVLHQAWNYGEEGIKLVLSALEDKSLRVRKFASTLLEENLKPIEQHLDLLVPILNDGAWTMQVVVYSLLQQNVEPALKRVLRTCDPYLRLEYLRTLTKHSESVDYSLAISPDGHTLASGSRDNINLWDLQTDELKTTFTSQGTNSYVAFIPDGQTLAYQNKLLNLHTGEERTFPAYRSGLYVLASDRADNTFKLWQLNDEPLQASLGEHLNWVENFKIQISYKTIELVEHGYPKTTFTGHSRKVTCVAISPDGQTLISGSEDQTLKVWDLHTGKLITTLTGHLGEVTCVAISPDGQTLVSGSDDCTLIVWDLHTGELRSTLAGHLKEVTCVAISPDGQTIASGSDDKTIKLWTVGVPRVDAVELLYTYLALKQTLSFDQASLESAIQALVDESWQVREITYALLQENVEPILKQALQPYHSGVGRSPSHLLAPTELFHRYLALKETLKLSQSNLESLIEAFKHLKEECWQVQELAYALALESGKNGLELVMHGLNYESWQVQCSAYAQLQRYAEPRLKPALRICNPYSRLKCLRTLTGHSYWVTCVAISSDGRTLVSGSADKTIKVWDLESGELKTTLTGPSWVTCLAISHDGRTLVSGDSYNTINVWDLENGQLKTTLTDDSNSDYSVAISPDGRTLVSGSRDKTIKVRDLESGELKTTFIGHSGRVDCVAITPDGQTVVSQNRDSSDNTVKFWNLDTGHLKTTIAARWWDSNFVISPDQRIFAIKNSKPSGQLWDLESGEVKTTLIGASSGIKNLSISPDGRTIAGEAYKTINVWDLDSGEVRTILTGHSDSIMSIAISPDGQTIASGSQDRTIKVWGIENLSRTRFDPVVFIHHYLALKEALQSDQAGLERVITALKDKSWEAYEAAYSLLQGRQEPIVKQALQEYSDALSSAVGIDYTRLRHLLVTQQWQEAEQETQTIMLQISGCSRDADIKSILNPVYVQSCGVIDSIECSIPPQDLQTISDLWEKYSKVSSSFMTAMPTLNFWIAVKTKLEEMAKENQELSATYTERSSEAYAEDMKHRL
ncbi:GUN4 domain-containing protein [Microcoleus sp. FACHB-672]|nr:GUN4 domain-containing protein [Microcoleus sp. FACHB-672]